MGTTTGLSCPLWSLHQLHRALPLNAPSQQFFGGRGGKVMELIALVPAGMYTSH